MDSTHQLLEKARTFDLDALAEVYDVYSPRIYRFAIRMLGDEQQAEDCVGHTFHRFLQVLQEQRGPRDQLQAYLFRIAHNWIIDSYRTQPTLPLDPDKDDSSDDVCEIAMHRIQKEQMLAALSRLTVDQRAVLILKYLEGWDHHEIAGALHKPTGAVKALQHRAVTTLRKHLCQKEEIYEIG